jgi:hypothetical protein
MDLILPNLSLLSIDAGPERHAREAPRRGRPAPRKKDQVAQANTDDSFHVLLNNCAAFVQRIFTGFVTCPIGLLWKNMPTRCRPIKGSGATLPDPAEEARVVKIFLEGVPSSIRGFNDVLRLVNERPFKGFVLATYPNTKKVEWYSIAYHAMVGLLFEDAENPEKTFGVTFGAYPQGALFDDSCALNGQGACGETKVVIVLGDQIGVCARKKNAREMRVKVMVPGELLKPTLEAELRKLT